jgi:hypothetical protein
MITTATFLLPHRKARQRLFSAPKISFGEKDCLLFSARFRLIVPKEESLRTACPFEMMGEDLTRGGSDEGVSSGTDEAAKGVDTSFTAATSWGCFGPAGEGETGGSLSVGDTDRDLVATVEVSPSCTRAATNFLETCSWCGLLCN